MGRRKNNPDLVNELIDGLWTMDDAEFDEKYWSLSSDDRFEVSMAIDNMENEWEEHLDYYDDDKEDESERLSVWDAADIWQSSGKDEDYMFGYSADELEDAL